MTVATIVLSLLPIPFSSGAGHGNHEADRGAEHRRHGHARPARAVHDAVPVRDRRGHSPRVAEALCEDCHGSGSAGSMKRLLVTVCLLSGLAAYLPAHERGTTPITWNREISRLVYDKCASCHRPDGGAFSLMTYQDVQPRLVEIKEAVLSRRMPPWGAVKGFGDFRNDQSLTQEQLELITDWIEDDAPKGNNPNVLPKVPKFDKPPVFKSPKGGLVVKNDMPLNRDLVLDGLWPERVPPDESMQVVATLPDGSVEPLLWLHDYNNAQRHPFLFREPLALPSGTVIRGVSQDARLVLIPAKTTKISK